jgi:hypothetical protein
MEKTRKLIAGLVIALVAIGALVIAPNVLAENDQEALNISDQSVGCNNRRKVRHPLLLYILKNGEYGQMTGTVVAQKGTILVLEIVEDATCNVIVPPLWLVEGEIKNRLDLFSEGDFCVGSTITIDTLKVEYTQETYTITAYFTYRISVEGSQAKALLPFNIDTTSA